MQHPVFHYDEKTADRILGGLSRLSSNGDVRVGTIAIRTGIPHEDRGDGLAASIRAAIPRSTRAERAPHSIGPAPNLRMHGECFL
jgi:hypothetical protein